MVMEWAPLPGDNYGDATGSSGSGPVPLHLTAVEDTMLRGAASGCRWQWRGGEAGACTESLGSESGDVGYDADIDRYLFQAAADDGAEEAPEEEEEEEEEEPRPLAAPEKRRRGEFPPAMPRASGALFLRAERGGGRLVLTEVRAAERDRRVVFRASRDGGRLRLRFATDDDDAGAAARPEARGASGGVVPAAAVQLNPGAGGELCQVAAGRRGAVAVGAVMMGI